MAGTLSVGSDGGPGRVWEFDLLRAGAMCYIVFGWHHSDYIGAFHLKQVSPVFYGVAVAAMGVFCFISGYLLTVKNDFGVRGGGVGGVWEYVRTRFLRIYPLYVLAVVTMAGAVRLTPFAEMGWGVVVRACLLVTGVVNEPLLTLWFVNVIVMYYVLFPLMTLGRGAGWVLGLAGGVAAGAVGLHVGWGWVEPRAVVYLMPFTLGVLSARHAGVMAAVRSGWVAAVSGAVAVGYTLYVGEAGSRFAYVPQAVLGVPGAMWVAGAVTPGVRRWGGIWRGVMFLSYVSFCTYLFHRQVYALVLEGVGAQRPGTRAATVWLVGGPVLLAVAYGVQRGYDRVADAVLGRAGGGRVKRGTGVNADGRG